METDEIYVELREKGYLEYGKHIPANVLEELIGMKYEIGNWEFIGKFLHLKEYIEDKGYFCTSRGVGNGALRILHAKEWGKKLENLNKTILRKQKRAINTIRTADTDVLVESDKRNLIHEQHKLAMGYAAMKSAIYDI